MEGPVLRSSFRSDSFQEQEFAVTAMFVNGSGQN
jgi:hypothetical protein